MPNQTPNLSLTKPLPTEAYNISIPNDNMDKLDAAFGGMEDGLEYYFAQNGSGTFTGLNNLVGYIHNVTHIGENMRVVFKNTTANTGNVTINISGIGAIPILRKDSTQIPPGGLKANTVYMIYFDGTNFLLLGDGGEYGTAAAPQVLQGYTVGTEGGLVSGSIPTKNAQTFTPGMNNQTINSGQYLGGVQTILGDPDLIAGNVKAGVNIFGVNGTFSQLSSIYAATSNDLRFLKTAYVNGEVVHGSLNTSAGGNTIIPGTFDKTAVSGNTIVDNTISVAGSPNLIASNIKSGVNIFGVTGSYSGQYMTGTVSAGSSQVNYTSADYNATTFSTSTFRTVTVNGIPFRPKKILIYRNEFQTTGLRARNVNGVYSDIKLVNPSFLDNVNYHILSVSSSSFVQIPPSDITDSGFTLPVNSAAGSNFIWEAYG